MNTTGARPQFIDTYNHIAQTPLEDHLLGDPGMRARYTGRDRERYVRDAGHVLRLLHEALSAGNPGILAAYLNPRLNGTVGPGMPGYDAVNGLVHLASALERYLPRYMDAGARVLLGSFMASDPMGPVGASYPVEPRITDDLGEAYLSLLLSGDRSSAQRLVEEALDAGADIRDVYTRVLAQAQDDAWKLRKGGRIPDSKVHFVTSSTQLIIAGLYPRMLGARKAMNGRSLVAACIEGELHELGVRMVADFFELEGWDTRYLGANTPESGIVDVLNEANPDILAVACNMAYNLPAVKSLIAAVRNQPGLADTRVMVGGYPFRSVPGLWKSVGADACAGDAREAVRIGEGLMASGGASHAQ